MRILGKTMTSAGIGQTAEMMLIVSILGRTVYIPEDTPDDVIEVTALQALGLTEDQATAFIASRDRLFSQTDFTPDGQCISDIITVLVALHG